MFQSKAGYLTLMITLIAFESHARQRFLDEKCSIGAQYAIAEDVIFENDLAQSYLSGENPKTSKDPWRATLQVCDEARLLAGKGEALNAILLSENHGVDSGTRFGTRAITGGEFLPICDRAIRGNRPFNPEEKQRLMKLLVEAKGHAQKLRSDVEKAFPALAPGARNAAAPSTDAPTHSEK